MYYFSNFESFIRYGIILWGSSSAAQRVFLMQKRAIRYMFGLNFRESCKPMLINESILTLPSLYIFEVIKFVKSNYDKFKLQNAFHTYNTRFGNDLQYDLHRLELYKQSPFYIGAVFFNKLPVDIINLSSNALTNKLKTFFLQNVFYSIEEFLNYQF